jgi:hypothetical protein
VRDARIEVVRRLEVLRHTDAGTWEEASRQLTNALDTMNEAQGQAETMLERR